MSDDVTPKEQRATVIRAKRVANLKPCKPGESRNREGKNGYTKSLSLFREFFNAKDVNGKTRYQNVLESIYLGALNGSARTQMGIVDHMQGKAKEHIDLSNTDGSLRTPVVRVHFGKVLKPSDGIDETPR
jgi:hypothetical protein